MQTQQSHKAKKSLGQNFLKSEPALRKIIEAGEIQSEDTILEIGPGKGALTKKILEKGARVIAVEKDYELMEFLKMKFEKEIAEGKLILIEDDILEFDMQETVSKFPYKIIANIPYNITGAILKKFLTAREQPERMVLMVQNEVAKRIVARDGKESILSISVKAYGEPTMIMKVPARYFSPSPKVDSAVISIKNISRKLFEEQNTSPQPSPSKGERGDETVKNKILNSQIFEEKFWEIVKTGFAHKRKKLSGNLKSLKNYADFEKSPHLESIKDKRAEDLALLDWILLAK